MPRIPGYAMLWLSLWWLPGCGAPEETLDEADAGLLADAGPEVAQGGDAGGPTAGSDAGTHDAGPTAPDAVGPEAKVRVRVVAANLSSGKQQSYSPGHGVRILEGLDPDVVIIQEFNYGSETSAAIDNFVSVVFGEGFQWYREPKGNIPNGVISRWPILEAGYWEDPLSPNREFTWARIDLPGPRDLWAISVHLLTTKSSIRVAQVEALLGHIAQKVPEADLLIIGGDLNTNTDNEQCFAALDKVTSRAHRPRDQQGNPNTNADRTKPYDWLLPDKDLELFHDSVRLGKSVFSDGLVFDSRVYAPLSEVAPVQAGDSGASGMQHMAVVRDFLVPAGAP